MKLYKTSTKSLIIVLVTLGIIFLVVFYSRNFDNEAVATDTTGTLPFNKESTPTGFVSPAQKQKTFQEQNPQMYIIYESPNPPAYEKAKIAKALIVDDIPFSVPFYASNGKRLRVTMNTLPEDPPYLVRAEIYGINYYESEANQETNPEAKAFVEAFEFLKKRIERYGVDPYSLYYVFGTRTYVAETANKWVKEFGLL